MHFEICPKGCFSFWSYSQKLKEENEEIPDVVVTLQIFIPERSYFSYFSKASALLFYSEKGCGMENSREVEVCYLFKAKGCPCIVPARPKYLVIGLNKGRLKIGHNQCGKLRFCGFYPLYGPEEFFADYTVMDGISRK